MLLVPIFLPIVCGVILLSSKRLKETSASKILTFASAAVSVISVFIICAAGGELKIWDITENVSIALRADGLSRVFSALTSVIWLIVGVYAFNYMSDDRAKNRFFGFYLISLGVLIGLDYSANAVTMYLFYELVTLASLPLVLHTLSKEAVSAAVKYLLYSVFGAFAGLFGIICLSNYSPSLDFKLGGSIDISAIAENRQLVLAAVFIMLLGFGVKAGLFPLQGWLPTAHPVAPAPASAVLSGIIAKAGVFASIRTIYYLVGTDFLKGTWVQETYLSLALFTVLLGSVMAYWEDNFKKRLAYSTVSQISYILFGIGLFNETAFTGGILHVVFHAVIKCALFMTAGAIIKQTGYTKVSQLRGIGKRMPVAMWCYTICSLALIGIPPTSGFVSKWYLCTGALSAESVGIIKYIGPVVLIVSALLTAGYLLPITTRGFFPGEGFEAGEKCEPSATTLVPMLILAAASVYFGVFQSGLISVITNIFSGAL